MPGLAQTLRWNLSTRRRYARTGDWLASLYQRAARSLPLPGRGATRELHLRDVDGPLYARLATSDINVLEEIFFHDTYAPVLPLKHKGVATIIDLGANVGYASRYFQIHFPGAWVVAVEPDEDNLRLCRLNAPSATPIRACAVGRARQVFLDRSRAAWAFQMSDSAQAGDPVDGLTVPQILERAGVSGPVDLLKCDIEGAEAELFDDCSAWIAKVRAAIVELHAPYTSAQLLEDLRRNGAQFTRHAVSMLDAREVVLLS